MLDNSKNGIASCLFWKFGERFFAQGVSFAVSIVLARVLTPQDFGLVAMVMIFITFADVFVVSGFSTALIQNKNATDDDFSTMYYCSLCFSCILYVILSFISPIVASFYNEPALVDILRFFSLRIPLSAYNSIQHAYVSRNMLFKKFFFSTLVGTIISGIVGVFFAYHGFGPYALIAQYFTNTIIDTIVLAFTIPWRIKLVFSKESAKSMMKYGWKVLAADFSGTFFTQLRSLIVGKFFSSVDLAYYNRGAQFPDLIETNLSVSIMSVLFPALSNKSDNNSEIKKLLRSAVRIMSFCLAPLFIGLIIIAKPLVLILYTDKWSESIPFVQIISMTALIAIVGSISLQALKAVGRSDVLLKIEFIKKPLYLILLILGVKINVTAVALSMLIYTIYSSIVNMWQLKKYLGYSLGEQCYDVFSNLLLSLIMSIIIYPLQFLLGNYVILVIAQITVGGLLYLGVAHITRNKAFLYLMDRVKYMLKKGGGS